MTTQRGAMKQRLRRAISAGLQIEQHLRALEVLYTNETKYSEACGLGVESAQALQVFCKSLLENLP